MLRLRSLVALTAALAAIPTAANAAGTRTVDLTVPMACEGASADGLTYGFETRNELTLRATVPDTTAPGEPIELTDISGTFSGRYGSGITGMGDDPRAPRDTAWVDIDAIGLTLRGATDPTLDVRAPGTQLPAAPVLRASSNLWTYTATLSGPLRSTTTTTAGTAPVVIDIDQLTVRRSLGNAPTMRPVPAGPAETCRYWSPGRAATPLAVITSTAGAPPAPVVTSISPNVGPLEGGNVVTIKGDHFTYAREILSDRSVELRRPFVIKDDETIEYTVPTCGTFCFSASYDLQVQSPFGTSVTSVASLYSRGGPPQPLPTITSVTPNRIPVPVRDFQVTIEGTGLDRVGVGQLVLIGGQQNGRIRSVNAEGTQAIVDIPLLSADEPLGASSIAVIGTGPCETARCQSADTPGDDITIVSAAEVKPVPTITSVAPNRFPTTQGTITFTITGSGLDDIDGLVFLRAGFGQGLIQSVNADGTEAVVQASIYDRDWSNGTANVTVVGKGPCVATPCESVDTPGDDLTFYTPPTSVDFSVQGAATLKTLVRGSVPLTGTLTGVAPAAGTDAVAADLALSSGRASLLALGFLPVTAQLTFTPTERLTGSLRGTALALTAKLRIKVPRVTLFGLELGGGSSCQARQVSSVQLASASPFTLAGGGSLAGSFAISDLAGCGPLTGILSPLTAGSGNALALGLTPAA